eukprot:s1096_g37.t1
MPSNMPISLQGIRDFPRLSRLAEKPTREFAEEHLVTPQLPEGTYLASFGHYILTFSTFRALRANKGGHFTHILDELRLSEGVDGVLIEGERWDLGNMQTYIQCLQAQAQDDQAPSKRRSLGWMILVSPAHGLHFQTEDENATDGDLQGPKLLNAHATVPRNGALQTTREFHFFFNEVALRGPGALALLRRDESRGAAATVVDDLPIFRSVLSVPGMVGSRVETAGASGEFPTG